MPSALATLYAEESDDQPLRARRWQRSAATVGAAASALWRPAAAGYPVRRIPRAGAPFRWLSRRRLRPAATAALRRLRPAAATAALRRLRPAAHPAAVQPLRSAGRLPGRAAAQEQEQRL